MPTPDEFKKLTDSTIPEFSGTIADNDVFHMVDVSNTTQDPAGSSFRTLFSSLWTYIQTKVLALGYSSLTNITKSALDSLVGSAGLNLKATYRITDSSQGIIRVTAKTASLLTATAMKEGSDDGDGTVTAGEWGNYDLDADVFTPSATSGTFTVVISEESGGTAADSSGAATYTIVGDVVSLQMLISVSFTASNQMFFEVTPPIASAFNTGGQGAVAISGQFYNEDNGFLTNFSMNTGGLTEAGNLRFQVDSQNSSSGGYGIQILCQYNIQA